MLTDIIFDFFGTLVDYDPPLIGKNYKPCQIYLASQGFLIDYDRFVTAWQSTFEELEERAKTDYKEFHMLQVAQLYFEREFSTSVEPEIATSLIRLVVEAWGKGVHYHPEIKVFLEELSRNFRLSIITNTHYPPMIHEHLHKMKIHSIFTEIVTSVEHGYRKPHLSIFKDTINRVSTEPQKVLYVGDNFAEDYLGAKEAGLQAVLIDRGTEFLPLYVDRIPNLFNVVGYVSNIA